MRIHGWERPLLHELCGILVGAVHVAALTTALGAQPAATIPVRPELPAGLDANESASYVLYARQYLTSDPAKALAGAYWASRIDPTNADALILRWRASWMLQPKILQKLERGDTKGLDTALVTRIDSLYLRAMLRDPFSIGSPDAGGPSGVPIDVVRKWLAKHPDAVGLWVYQAAAFYRQRELDSTIANMRQALAAIDRVERGKLQPVYHSREIFHYAIGKMLFALKRYDEARSAFESALTEDLSFYPAHAALATIAATLGGDVEIALHEYALAAELNPGDGILFYDYGTALLRAQRWQEALEQFDRAAALEPYFPDVHHNRGLALDRLGRRAEAVAAYREFISRAPKRLSAQADLIRGRIAALTEVAADSAR